MECSKRMKKAMGHVVERKAAMHVMVKRLLDILAVHADKRRAEGRERGKHSSG